LLKSRRFIGFSSGRSTFAYYRSMRALLAILIFPLAAGAQAPCGAPTPEDMEGPFYKAGAPARASLAEPGSKAQRLVLTGTVRSADCKPLAGVRLDFWQADAGGDYDNQGYRYRGVVTSDAEGRYRLETNLPPPYMGRPRHIHVKLHRPGGRVLTTQLYFPGESRGADKALVVKLDRRDGAQAASFDFVLP
jgi:protocatechuate 3,4-dioxygenase beta subunit